jgi:hydrogenase expression/formation protein HypC
MCLTMPARVLAVENGLAVVAVSGRRRRAAIRFVPDIAPGEHVLVGIGEVLARLTEEEAASLAGDMASMAGAPPSRALREGDQR